MSETQGHDSRASRRNLPNLVHLALFALIALLGACSSGPSIDLDNEFWFGTITRAGSSGVVYAGLGFEQTGNDVRGTFAFADGSGDVTVCCMLRGTIRGLDLSMSDTDAVGDQIIISGRFDAGGSSMTGTLSFVIDGVRDDFHLEMAYESQLSAVSLRGAEQGLMLREVAAFLR